MPSNSTTKNAITPAIRRLCLQASQSGPPLQATQGSQP